MILHSRRQPRGAPEREPGRLIGLAALQLAEPPAGPSVAQLAAEGRLSHPPGPLTALSVPGDAETQEVLGYLHANCGNCHNPHGTAWPDTGLDLRLLVDTPVVEATGLYRTGINAPLDSRRVPGCSRRVAPGRPEASALWVRLASRDAALQMPPMATEIADAEAVDRVRRWILALADEELGAGPSSNVNRGRRP